MKAKRWHEVKATRVLRDRLIAAIERVDEQEGDWVTTGEIADAVLDELGLRVQESTFTRLDSTESAAYRFVTAWTVKDA